MASITTNPKSKNNDSKNTETIIVPDDFYCPITGELMNFPVICPEGHSYEEAALKAWHAINPISPLTRNSLDIRRIRPNRSLKNAIDQIRDKLQQNQLKKDGHSLSIPESILTKITHSLAQMDFKSVIIGNKMLITATVPESDSRRPIDIVFVIDRSGSMGTEATLKGEDGKTISHGLNILNITVGAAKTVSHALDDNDRVGVVSFDCNAKIESNLINMTKENQSKLDTIMDNLRPGGTTNFWDGIYKGLETLRKGSEPGRLKYLLIMTDGIPTKSSEPPKGYIKMLQLYKEQNPEFDCIIDTAGFGYSLDSKLLEKVANEGKGQYGFIPDSSLTGNIFVHKAANMMTTAITNSTFKIELENGIEFSGVNPCMGHNKHFTKTSWGGVLETGPMNYGQTKHFVLDVNIDSSKFGISSNDRYLTTTFEYTDGINSSTLSKEQTVMYDATSDSFLVDTLHKQLLRLKLVNTINQCLELLRFQSSTENIRSLIMGLMSEIKTSALYQLPYLQNLYDDLNGQIVESLNLTQEASQHDYFSRWGKHWLLSIMTGHNTETCNNWKDPGVANYRSKLFDSIRDSVSDIFDNLPAPKPSTNYRDGGHYRGMTNSASTRSASPVSYSTYNVPSGPCFTRGNKVHMADGSYKNVEEIVKGDMVKTYGPSKTSQVLCKTKTICEENIENIVNIGTLKITPHHPVVYIGDGQFSWKFPADLGQTNKIPCEEIYSFVVENRGCMLIENVICATLGHNLKGDVIEHEYYGTDRVIDDLKSLPGWNSGEVVITKNMIKRDPNNLKVVSISFN